MASNGIQIVIDAVLGLFQRPGRSGLLLDGVGMEIRGGDLDMGSGTIHSSSIDSPTIAGGTATSVRHVHSVMTVTGNYTAGALVDYTMLSSSLGTISLTLPSAPGVDLQTATFTKIDASSNPIYVSGSTAAQTINGEAVLVIDTQYESVTLLSTGSVWFIV